MPSLPSSPLHSGGEVDLFCVIVRSGDDGDNEMSSFMSSSLSVEGSCEEEVSGAVGGSWKDSSGGVGTMEEDI